ncbi:MULTISPECIES: sensor histidine kinase [Zobellia]|uniref:histidine kinase n=1 Tax=Zobellia galactanivorans (strain DSM 12802 / CCUG 47099 / CIP 106680 / NCIMB 13871 / Dsij) TaxID=63186 RepID=G0LBE7_ZOBGA|nr:MULTISPECIES: GAF domain-containing sensor histidine kinase [Zobellia]OWW26999.1 histidine kinase [Zobellia sp. OII3]CAZ96009.1 Two-component system-Sensor histidine kinase [Zobellia galactanivorans]
MIAPEKHKREAERLALLESYGILDTPLEEDYDNLVTLASEICGTPISVVTLLDKDRQWFKAYHGIDVRETEKEYSFCGHTINASDSIFVIEDARIDERFHDNPMVQGDPHVIFYAGVPLKGAGGLPLGTLCVIDTKPRALTKSQVNALKILSDQIMNLLDLRKKKMELEKANEQLARTNHELDNFAAIAAHDLKSPLNNILTLSNCLYEDYAPLVDDEGKQIIEFIRSSSETLRKLITGLLDYSKSGQYNSNDKTRISLTDLHKNISELFGGHKECVIRINSELDSIYANKVAVEQILINLIANAIKYNDKSKIEIDLDVGESESHYEFSVRDNGPGINEEDQEKIFKIFEIVSPKDRFGEKGTGIGLATVKKVVEGLGGQVAVSSKVGEGATFSFTIKAASHMSPSMA